MASQRSGADLLIIGAGPAGLMAACCASNYDVSTRIIDQKSGRTPTGHADGIHSRTQEILESFGILEPILRQSMRDGEVCYWRQNKETGSIERQKRVHLQPDHLSRFRQVLLNQGLLEQVMIDYLNSTGRVQIEWNTRAESLALANETSGRENAFPVTVEASKLDEGGTAKRTETIKARYLVACDGAHSWTRRQTNVSTENKSDDSTWGVLDIVPITNFPDIRQCCVIQSDKHGSIMTVPRENRLVRLYVQLQKKGDQTETGLQQSEASPESLVKLSEKTMQPYWLTHKHCDWWSVYPISQRLVTHYRPHKRVFLAGDAAHTHSPKAGQGMNISIQDTYNLIWKICSVIIGIADPMILETYESERRPVAQTLMEMDSRLVQAYESEEGASRTVDEVREDYAGFMSGVEVTYQRSVLTTECRGDHAQHIKLGMRLNTFPVVNQSDGTTVELADRLTSTGRWRLLVFSGDLRQPDAVSRLEKFANDFSQSSHYSQTKGTNPLIEVILIHSNPRDAINLLDLPDIFRPFDETLGYDYWRTYADDSRRGEEPGKAYKGYGISDTGCLVLYRPDAHLAWIGGFSDLPGLNDFLSHFMGAARRT